MDFDAVINPAFSIASTPGAYAMLLGAGVSKSSGVPSAWDVQVELIQRVAMLTGESIAEADVETWWATHAGEPASYSGVLDKLTRSPHERQALLREMFEPNETEREQGTKVPTAAHHAVAQLVASGHVKVILTTNFDLLTEQALRELGIEPYVVSDPSSAAGLPPIHTLPALVVHLHGDYLSPTTMLNTSAELETYRPETAQLLKAILSTHGLVIAGWSAAWDPALRAAIEVDALRLYSPLWIEPSEPGEHATRLATTIGAHGVRASADDALPALAEAVASLEERRSRNPRLPGVLIQTVKRALSGKANSIDVHDLVRTEFERLRAMPELDLEESGSRQSGDVAKSEAAVAEAAGIPASLVAVATYWGSTTSDRWWYDELERFTRQARGGGLTRLLTLRRIAGARLYYAAGVAAVASERWDLLLRLLNEKATVDDNVLHGALLSRLFGPARSREIFEQLRPSFVEHLAIGAERYEDAWERFEFLQMLADVLARPNVGQLALKRARTFSEGVEKNATDDQWIPLVIDASRAVDVRGRFLRAQDHMYGWHSLTGRRFQAELEHEQDRHPLIQAGMSATPAFVDVAAQIVEAAISAAAEHASWSHVPPGGGIIPSFVWIDTK